MVVKFSGTLLEIAKGCQSSWGAIGEHRIFVKKPNIQYNRQNRFLKIVGHYSPEIDRKSIKAYTIKKKSNRAITRYSSNKLR